MKEYQLIQAANAASDITSVPVDLGDLKDCSVHCVFSSATLNGTLQLQASNNNSDWSNISDAGASQSVSSGASHMFNVIDAAYRYLRVFWDASSGTGTLTATATLKESLIKGA